LREYGYGRERLPVKANRSAQADFGGPQAIVATLARAVKEKDDRPFLIRAPLSGHEDLEAILDPAERQTAVKEPGFGQTGAGGRGEQAAEQ
jgi:hypothetical protein